MINLIGRIIFSLLIAVAGFYAFSTMIFGVMGTTAEDPGWAYAVTLYISLASVGFLVGIKNLIAKQNTAIARTNKIITASLTGMLLGFFYGGISSNNHPQIAIVTGVIFGAFLAFANDQLKTELTEIIVVTTGAIAAYGFVFIAGNYAIINLSTHHFFIGIVWTLITIIYLLLTINSFDIEKYVRKF
jgi:hypothetical protein